MPAVTINVFDDTTKAPIHEGVFVSIQQDKLFEGFKELARTAPDFQGKVYFEAASLTKYRIVADGSWYDSNEVLIDTGFNFAIPIERDMPLHRKSIPTPDLDIGRWTRDIGLAQIMPYAIIVVALAGIAVAIAYAISRVPSLGLGKKASAAVAKAQEAVKEKSENASQ